MNDKTRRCQSEDKSNVAKASGGANANKSDGASAKTDGATKAYPSNRYKPRLGTVGKQLSEAT